MEIKLRQKKSWWLLEWSPGNGQYYAVNRKNIECQGRGPAEYELARNFFNSLAIGLTARVEGSYNRKMKKLTLVL